MESHAGSGCGSREGDRRAKVRFVTWLGDAGWLSGNSRRIRRSLQVISDDNNMYLYDETEHSQVTIRNSVCNDVERWECGASVMAG